MRLAIPINGDQDMKQYAMVSDLGTTSNRCILFDKSGNVASIAQKEFN